MLRMLQGHVQIDRLTVRAFDAACTALHTVASVTAQSEEDTHDDRAPIAATDRKRLDQALAKGDFIACTGGIARLVFGASTRKWAGAALCGGLRSDGDLIGLAIVEPELSAFSAAERDLLPVLLEPLAAALENDHRFHELETLREAAEADKLSLLRRLGREELVDEIVGAGGGLRLVMERVELVARGDAPVLILGETGSGKEVIARAIHMKSPRARMPFIRVNCGAIAPELIDSELFGHEKGAFTGALAMRRGWFERADSGTLFLDEIGELPAAAQVRLLRVLQDGMLERVGGEHAMKVDVRIIAATHRDLPALIQQGRFREDLWYRIAVFHVVLPPLRERRDDIAALAEHFAHRAARRFGLPFHGLNEEHIELLRAYDWPGNVRELASVVDRAVILGDGRGIDVATALGGGSLVSLDSPIPAPGAAAIAARRHDNAPGGIVSLAEAMRSHIEQALRATGGRIEGRHGAASILRINPHTLRARMRKLGINWAGFRTSD
jgi:transcriptional regulator with GAF, ATPase, and Fis domain